MKAFIAVAAMSLMLGAPALAEEKEVKKWLHVVHPYCPLRIFNPSRRRLPVSAARC
jgi:hypothetical protein